MSEDVWCQLQVRVPASWARRDTTYDDQDKPFLEPEKRSDWEALCVGVLYENGSPQAWLNAAWEEFYGCPDLDIEFFDNVAEVRMSGDLNYATLNAAEELVRLRVPYMLHNDAKYEIDANDEFYDGNFEGKVRSVDSSNNYISMVPLGTLLDLRARWAHAPSGFGPAVSSLIDELNFDLSNCNVDHLRVHPVFVAIP